VRRFVFCDGPHSASVTAVTAWVRLPLKRPTFPRLKGGGDLFRALRERLGSDLDPIYETYETPYAIYSVFKGQNKIGIVHGVNVPGKGGVVQVFLSMDPRTAEIESLLPAAGKPCRAPA
jgi:hypothetical protein